MKPTKDQGEGQDAYALILQSIDKGDVAPGERLVETDLANTLGVSRTPIREALQRLEAHGIATRDGRSLRVAQLDHDQLGELYEVRATTEGLAAKLAARHAAPEEIDVLAEMAAADRALVGDSTALGLANRRFHAALHRASHNRYLTQMLLNIRRSLVLLSSSTLIATSRAETSLDEHDGIVAAIANRDEDAAQLLAAQHI
ncbi:MAG: GntR family transcriptional regulator, partial [Pseudomonadota bacterium]